MRLTLFKPLNSTVEKSNYTITIKNQNISNEHWGSEANIVKYLDEIDTFLYDKETSDKRIVKHATELAKYNMRFQEMEFFRVPEENKLILFVVVDAKKFEDNDPFTREINISFKRHNKFSFSIVEIYPDDLKAIKEGTKTFPATWQKDEAMSNKLTTFRNIYN
jgi:hypothetical protein